jgi:HAD domain in Swiss Army Knife RNA repair proteins
MKVLFTDIDGVLNCRGTPNPRKLPYVIDPSLLARFKAVVEATGAKVVLSSTWRYDPAGLFSARHWGLPFDDIVPDMPGRPRRDEILSWLAAHPDVARYAVLDDDDDGLDPLPLFQPSSRQGLTQEICDGLVQYLNGLTDRDMPRSGIVRWCQNILSCLGNHKG